MWHWYLSTHICDGYWVPSLWREISSVFVMTYEFHLCDDVEFHLCDGRLVLAVCQRHCKDYWISFPTTIHGSKIRVITIEISWKSCKVHQLTSRGHNFRSDRCNFSFFSVLEIKHPNLHKDTKISSIRVCDGLQICI